MRRACSFFQKSSDSLWTFSDTAVSLWLRGELEMKTKLLAAIALLALIIFLAGCVIVAKTPSILQSEEESTSAVTVSENTELIALEEDVQSAEQNGEMPDTAEKEIADETVRAEAEQTAAYEANDEPAEAEDLQVEDITVQSESPKAQEPEERPMTAEPVAPEEKQTEPIETPGVTEPPELQEPPEESEQQLPLETEAPPEEIQPKTAYDFEFDIDAIRADCIAIGQSMGYTLNASLTPQNATWWNPVTASELNQGDALKSSLERYIRFHTKENLGAYGMDEITEFNICCESRGNGSYAIYFLFA